MTWTYRKSRVVTVWDDVPYQHVTKSGVIHLARQGARVSECGLLDTGRRYGDKMWEIVDDEPTCQRCLHHILRYEPQ